MSLEKAVYHLGYEVEGEQPVINVHSHPESFEVLTGLEADLSGLQEYLHMDEAFAFDADAFGYGGVGRLEPSPHVDGWSKLRLALPAATSEDSYWGASTPQVLPVVSTLSTAFHYLRQLIDLIPTRDIDLLADPNRPQLIMPSLNNEYPLDRQYSARFCAQLTPFMLDELETNPDIEIVEQRVREALKLSFQYPYGGTFRDDDFRVKLGEDIDFKYPGDGTGFFANRERKMTNEGIRIVAANNYHPLQQIGILGGLAAMSEVVLEQ